MTGRLASEFIATAGIPQKIYTVPAGKTFSGHIGAVNTTGGSTIIQVKHGQGIATPTSTFTLSNAEQLGDASAIRPGDILYDLGSNIVACTNSSTYPRSIDLTDQLVPVVGFNMNGSQPTNSDAWAAADRYGASYGSNEFRRYLGSVNPWEVGTYGSVTGGASVMSNSTHTRAGWGQYVATFGSTADNLAFTSAAPTSGSTTWSSDTFTNLGGLAATHASYWGGSYCQAFAVNGHFFMVYPSTNGAPYRRIAAISAASVGMGASWVNVGGNIYTNYNNIDHIFYANGNYYFATKLSTSYMRFYKVASADILTFSSLSTPLVDSGVQYSVYGYSFDISSMIQLGNGDIVWRANGTYYVLDPTTDTVSLFVSTIGDTTVSANYTGHHGGKLSPVEIGAVNHSVPRDGAGDPGNDRIIYSSNGIYKFVDDSTWDLSSVSDDADWIDYDLTLAHKDQVEYRGRMFNAADEIWVRSNVPNLTVSVEGFLL